jgi:septum site-determining protein MinC
MHPPVKIKGIREGLLVNVRDGDWQEVQKELLVEMEKQADFLRGGKIILDVQNHALNAATLGKLRELLSDHELSLWAVLSNSPKTEKTAQALGLATRIHQSHPNQVERSLNTNLDGDVGTLVRRTLRSGYRLEHPGHVTVIGDVNPGAQIIAGGNIVVWGRLRGLAHAGADGDENAIVCALDLSPTQLRIAGQISIPPQDRGDPQPEVAYIRDERVVAETWNPRRTAL